MHVNPHATDPAPGSVEVGDVGGAGRGVNSGCGHDPGEVLSLDGEMTLSRAAELKQMFLASIDRAGLGRAVYLDLAKVTDLDSSGVQLLLLARRMAAARKCTLHLSACSHVVWQVLSLMNLTATFGGSSSLDTAGELAR